VNPGLARLNVSGLCSKRQGGMTLEGCICSEVLRTPITKATNAPTGNRADPILATCDLLARSEAKTMSIYRCRVCGALWAEGCYDRGQVMWYYLFPAPQTDDPVRWLHEEAVDLPQS